MDPEVKKKRLLRDMRSALLYLDTLNDKLNSIINTSNGAIIINGVVYGTSDLNKIKNDIARQKNKLKYDIIPSLEEEVGA